MKKQKKKTKRKLNVAMMMLEMRISSLRKLDSDSLNKYAKMYGIKSPKGKPPYTDKELVRELSKFIPSKKITDDYWKCIKNGKKKIGKYPFQSRNNTSKEYKKMSLSKKVKHTNRKTNKLRKKYKKQINSYHKKSRSLYDKCEKQKKKQMDKQIQGK
tara:strand:+ start:147 stop:617 length:471 start_codon:yes stop_codon:yes gene_type:complete